MLQRVRIITVFAILLIAAITSQLVESAYDLRADAHIRTIMSQVQTYDTSIKRFTEQYGFDPSNTIAGSEYWQEAIQPAELKKHDRKGLGKALNTWRSLALSNNIAGNYSNDRVGRNIIIPDKNPIYLNRVVPSKKSLTKLYDKGELISPFQMNDFMALMLQGKYDPEQRIKELRRLNDQK